MCQAGETCGNCPADCGVCACVHDKCQPGAPLQSGCDPCVTQICAQFPSCCAMTWGSACVAQIPTKCGVSCGGGPVCGNGTCEAGENCSSCPADCGACPPVCGNGTCEAGENCANCPGDCGACPPVCHDVCVTGPLLSPSCSSCAAFVCIYVDSYCCTDEWDFYCVDEANSYCAFCY